MFDALALAGVQDATPTGVLACGAQVVVTKLASVPALHEATSVGPVVLLAQVTVA